LSPPKFVRQHQPFYKTTTTAQRSYNNNNNNNNHHYYSSVLLYSKKTSKKKADDFLDILESGDDDHGRLPVSNDRTVVPDDVQDDPLAPLVSAIVRSADGRKAEDIRAIRVSKLTATTSFIVLVSGNSRPQNQAIAAAVQDAARRVRGSDTTCRGSNGVAEGTADSGWILLDYGDVMVHVMTPKSRLFYDIEGKWQDGEDMDLSAWLVPNTAVLESSDSASSGSSTSSSSTSGTAAPLGGGMSNLDKEEDPFWS